jgi:hypothetical protein
MAEAKAIDDAAIREQAYFLWEADGRPHGNDVDYWSRAVAVLTAKAKPAKAKPAKAPAAKSKGKTEPAKLKAAASKTKAAPSKSVKPAPAKKPAKPKKK